MTAADNEAENRVRYDKAMHSVQAAIGFSIPLDPHVADPKHLRTGIDSAHVSIDALARLLIGKGIITGPIYLEALAEAAEREQASYQRRLSDLMGVEVKPV